MLSRDEAQPVFLLLLQSSHSSPICYLLYCLLSFTLLLLFSISLLDCTRKISPALHARVLVYLHLYSHANFVNQQLITRVHKLCVYTTLRALAALQSALAGSAAVYGTSRRPQRHLLRSRFKAAGAIVFLQRSLSLSRVHRASASLYVASRRVIAAALLDAPSSSLYIFSIRNSAGLERFTGNWPALVLG